MEDRIIRIERKIDKIAEGGYKVRPFNLYSVARVAKILDRSEYVVRKLLRDDKSGLDGIWDGKWYVEGRDLQRYIDYLKSNEEEK